MSAEEQKWVLCRVRYECHDLADLDVYALTVSFCVDPVPQPFDDGDTLVDEEPEEGHGEPDCQVQVEELTAHQP